MARKADGTLCLIDELQKILKQVVAGDYGLTANITFTVDLNQVTSMLSEQFEIAKVSKEELTVAFFNSFCEDMRSEVVRSGDTIGKESFKLEAQNLTLGASFTQSTDDCKKLEQDNSSGSAMATASTDATSPETSRESSELGENDHH